MYDIKAAVILAAGLGTRLKELTKDVPKCLMLIGDKPLLKWQVDVIKSCGITDIKVVVGREGSCWTEENRRRIREICPGIIINEENSVTNNNYSLVLGLKDITDGPALSIDGDVFFDKDTLLEVINSKYDTLILSRLAETLGDIGSKVVFENNKVVNISKNIIPKVFPWAIHSGIIKIGTDCFDIFKEIINKEKYHAVELGPPLQELAETCDLYNLMPESNWVNVNKLEELSASRKIAALSKQPYHQED